MAQFQWCEQYFALGYASQYCFSITLYKGGRIVIFFPTSSGYNSAHSIPQIQKNVTKNFLTHLGIILVKDQLHRT